MKWMIASDLHGSAQYTEALLDAYAREGADRLILLGDLLNHGPRNGLPDGYDPIAAAAMLNERKDEILCVRGNCDSEVDQMVLEFPILAEYALLSVGERLLFLTHGHRFHTQNPPPLKAGDCLIHGHTHLCVCEPQNGYLYCNPGSVTFPKDGHRGYLLLDGASLHFKTLDGTAVHAVSLDANEAPEPFAAGVKSNTIR